MDRENATATAERPTGADDLFALTDEQILEIEPEGAVARPGSARQGSVRDDMELLEDAADDAGDGAAELTPAASTENAQTSASDEAAPGNASSAHGKSVANGIAQDSSLGAEPPKWLAEMMNDSQAGGEARNLWNSAQQARQEASAFREVFAKPEEARSAADRARQLDEIDRSYFAGDAAERSRLAATMLREDPVAFREMVFAGLRALDEAGKSGGLRQNAAGESSASQNSPANSVAAAHRDDRVEAATSADSAAKTAGKNAGAENANLREYAAFEKSANEELERSVGGAIERTLEQALPATARGGTQQGSALQQKLGVAIRQDVEKALQGDRQLGEQVGQILSSRRLDGETRAQIVRLIGERARQLVPGAAKKVLADWTQTTIAAHRTRTGRVDGAAARQEIGAAAAGQTGAATEKGKSRQSAGVPKTDRGDRRGVDYRRLSDEDILSM
ncbi:MAG TPA: hypothetical protein VGI16_06465 [Candidatus Acidoferrum sp.]|jgi:hypothetical protein